MKIFSLLVFIIGSISSCSSEGISPGSQFRVIVPDTSKFPDIHSEFEVNSSNLNLPIITEGVDSFELRVWVISGMVRPNQLSILRFKDSVWELSLSRFWNVYVNDHKGNSVMYFDSSITNSKIIDAKSSEGLDSITSFRLDSIPSQLEIDGFEDRTADGWTFTIEIATSKYYKILQYRNPQSYDDPTHTQVNSILYLLSQKLEFYYPYKLKNTPFNATAGG